MLRKIILFLPLLFLNVFLFAQSDETTKSNIKDNKFNFVYQKHSGELFRAVANKFTGFYLSNISWKDNENKVKTLLIDFVKNIKITGYTQVKKQTGGDLSIIYYFPYMYDIELKNGIKIKNASGRINEIDSFEVFTEFGKEKCFTYFIRYWLEDKKVFSDNNSSNYGEKVDVPKELVVYLEFK